MTPLLFALDHNFSPTIVKALSPYIPEANLVPVGDIDPRMPVLEDWELLVALRQRSEGWAGLVTNDADFVTQPRELAALMQTGLAVIVAESAGHDPIKAAGLLLAHLPGICKRIIRGRAQVWRLRTADLPHTEPWDLFTKLAVQRKQNADQLFADNKLSVEELTSPVGLGLPPKP